MELVKSVVDEIPEEIYQILAELGVPVHLEGYNFIAYASYLLLNDINKDLRVNYDVYPVVAEAFDRKRSSVERLIRFAIMRVFNETDPDITEKYFGNTISADEGTVSNSQFLYTVARFARRKILSSSA